MRLRECFIVSLPIGHPRDISLRALDVLKGCPAIIMESRTRVKKLFDLWGIPLEGKDTFLLTRKNEATRYKTLADTLVKTTSQACLICDVGTPLIDDPGYHLMQELASYGVQITYVPGASSLVAALVLCGYPVTSFYYAGFLPREPKRQQRTLEKIQSLKAVTVLLESPHRMASLVSCLYQALAPKTPLTLLSSLTTPSEKVISMSLEEAKRLAGKGLKKEPCILVLDLRDRRDLEMRTKAYRMK